MINLWLALRSDAEAELTLWQLEENLTDDQVMVKDAILSHPDLKHIVHSTKRMVDGATSWGMYSMYLADSDTVMSNLSLWLDIYEGKAFVCGCWEWNGLQVGTSRDEEGNILGTPIFPMDARLINFMLDDVTYDLITGEELTRAPAVELKLINLLFGQALRKY